MNSVIAFEHIVSFVETPLGNKSEGNFFLSFVTPHGTIYRTSLGPKAATAMIENLTRALSTMAIPVDSKFPAFPGSGISGPETTASKTVVFFGQQYPEAILTSLGMLVTRVNILEKHLIALFSALANMPLQEAEALLFSTVNARARLSMIRVLVPFSKSSSDQQERVLKALTKVDSLSDRRNTLIHGTWAFKKDKFEVEMFFPNKAKHNQLETTIVTANSIEELATDFNAVGLEIMALAGIIKSAHS